MLAQILALIMQELTLILMKVVNGKAALHELHFLFLLKYSLGSLLEHLG